MRDLVTSGVLTTAVDDVICGDRKKRLMASERWEEKGKKQKQKQKIVKNNSIGIKNKYEE